MIKLWTSLLKGVPTCATEQEVKGLLLVLVQKVVLNGAGG